MDCPPGSYTEQKRNLIRVLFFSVNDPSVYRALQHYEFFLASDLRKSYPPLQLHNTYSFIYLILTDLLLGANTSMDSKGYKVMQDLSESQGHKTGTDRTIIEARKGCLIGWGKIKFITAIIQQLRSSVKMPMVKLSGTLTYLSLTRLEIQVLSFNKLKPQWRAERFPVTFQ